MSALQAYLAIAAPVVAALAAVGLLLSIKIVRHRQAAKDSRRLDAVPARPMSAGEAAGLRRRYLVVAALVLGLLLLSGLCIAWA